MVYDALPPGPSSINPGATFTSTPSIGAAPMQAAPVWTPPDSGSSGVGSLAYWLALTGGGSVVPASSLRSTGKARAAQQMSLAAMDAVLPVPYGIVQLQGLLANVLYWGYMPNGVTSVNKWVFFVIWGEGEIASIDAIYQNGVLLTNGNDGVSITNYTGAASQTVDPTLVSVYASQSAPQVWNLPLVGIAYSVIAMPKIKTVPNFVATIHGRKIYDPRLDSTNGGAGTQRLTDSTTWTFSNNPTLILTDFLTTPTTLWGCGATMLWPSVITGANLNDVVLGTAPNTEKSRVCDIVLDRVSSVSNWKDTLCAAANVFLAENQKIIKLVPDVGGAPVMAFSRTAGNIISMGTPQFPDVSNLPTAIDVTFTDASALPWKDDTVPTVKRAGVDAGTTQFRLSSVPMQWIKSKSQATREATERLNKIWLRGVKFQMEVFDEGLKCEVGDIVSVDDAEYGFSVLPVKIISAAPTGKGTWMLQVQKEDVGAYSNIVQINPTTPNTDLPNPNAPLPVTGLTAAEELYQVQTGLYASRLRIGWVEPIFTFTASYRIEVLQAGALMESGSVDIGSSEYVTGPLKEDLLYTVNVYVLSIVGALGPATTVTVTISGKNAIPSDVAIFNGYDVGGEVRLSWSPAIDLDLTGYEIRYGLTSDTWASAVLLDRVATPTLRYSTKIVAPGTKRFFIKALDSVRSTVYPFGQLSANAAFCDVNISLDPDSFVAATYTWTTPALTNMIALGTTPQSWQTDYGSTFAALFTLTLFNYTNTLASYFGSGTSTLLSESFDFGQVYAGLLTNNAVWTDVSGTASVYLETSLDNVTFTQFPGQSAQIAARYVRLRITTTGVVNISDMGTMQLSVVAVSETGTIMTSAAGWVTVTLSRQYSRVKTIQLTSDGSLGVANPVYDQNSITLVGDPRYLPLTYAPEDYVDEAYSPLGSFAVECFDNNDNLLARSTNYLFQGI